MSPSTPFALFASVMMGVLSLLTYLVRNIVKQQVQMNVILSNHFAHDLEVQEKIATHMATMNSLLSMLSERVLGSALRAPESRRDE